MAGEVKGQIYEAITKVALELAVKGNRKGWEIFRHKQPEWVTIEADLTVGKDKDHPEILLLVTHSTSVKLYEKKFWRNFAEIFQYKVQGDTLVRCFSILFDSHVKPALRKVSDAFIDGYIEAFDIPGGKEVIKFIEKNQKNFGVSDQARIAKVERLLNPEASEFDIAFSTFASTFAEQLSDLLKKENKTLNPLWDILRQIDQRRYTVPSEKNTYVRNGIAKLLIFDDRFREHVFKSIIEQTPISDEIVPRYSVDLNLVKEGLCGCEIEDNEIISTVKLLGEETCQRLIKAAPKRMQDFADPLRSVGNLDAYSAFVNAHFAELATTAGMREWLLACYRNPIEILPKGSTIDIPPRDTWLFLYCMTIEKAEKGRILDYGLSRLAEETGLPFIGGAGGGLVIAPFIYRQKMLPDDMLEAIARVFAEKISRLGREAISSTKFIASMKKMLIQRQLYILMVYRFFDPIGDLIRLSLNKHSVRYSEEYVSTCLREYSGAAGAKSQFIKGGVDTLIYRQTCHGSHVNDKTKELSARFRATKAAWDGNGFRRRPEAKHIYFVADGEWREEDFSMLMRSGVDDIFYPDQMDELVASLASEKTGKRGTPPGSAKLPVPSAKEASPVTIEEDLPELLDDCAM